MRTPRLCSFAPSVLGLTFTLVLGPPLARAQTSPSFSPPAAHVAVVDGAASIERDRQVEPLDTGVPLLDGDRLHTNAARLEVRFEDGTSLYLDESSILDVLSPATLRLIAGGLVFDVPDPVDARDPKVTSYQIDTPGGTLAIDVAGEYRVSVHADRPERAAIDDAGAWSTTVEVIRGGATFVAGGGRVHLRSGEQSIARGGLPPGFPVRFNSARWDGFARWVENLRADRYRTSASAAYLPLEVTSYADTFDNHGAWEADPTYGDVWYPTVAPGWRPYYNGRWTWRVRLGWTWIASDPWGWPTHHYGRWGIGTRGRWFWIPARQWGPAWVSWSIAPSYVSWCPLGFDGYPVLPFSTRPAFVYDRVLDLDFAWTTVPGHGFGGFVSVRRLAIPGRRLIERDRIVFVQQRSGPRVDGRRGGFGRVTPEGVFSNRPRGGDRRAGTEGTDRPGPDRSRSRGLAGQPRYAVPRDGVAAAERQGARPTERRPAEAARLGVPNLGRRSDTARRSALSRDAAPRDDRPTSGPDRVRSTRPDRLPALSPGGAPDRPIGQTRGLRRPDRLEPPTRNERSDTAERSAGRRTAQPRGLSFPAARPDGGSRSSERASRADRDSGADNRERSRPNNGRPQMGRDGARRAERR